MRDNQAVGVFVQCELDDFPDLDGIFRHRSAREFAHGNQPVLAVEQKRGADFYLFMPQMQAQIVGNGFRSGKRDVLL